MANFSALLRYAAQSQFSLLESNNYISLRYWELFAVTRLPCCNPLTQSMNDDVSFGAMNHVLIMYNILWKYTAQNSRFCFFLVLILLVIRKSISRDSWLFSPHCCRENMKGATNSFRRRKTIFCAAFMPSFSLYLSHSLLRARVWTLALIHCLLLIIISCFHSHRKSLCSSAFWKVLNTSKCRL